MSGLPPPEGEEEDPVSVEIDVGPHEPVAPVPPDREHPTEDVGSPSGVGSAEENDVSPEGVLERQRGSKGSGPAGGCCVDAEGMPVA